MRTQISQWTMTLRDRQGVIVWQERNGNTLHLDGEKYILSAAFATNLTGFGAAPPKLYMGLDARPTLLVRDTLAEAARHEPVAASYKRIPISTSGDFTPGLEAPSETVDMFGENQKKVFTLKTSGLFAAIGEDYGTVANSFLTTAAQGSQGSLIISSPLRHSFDFWEGYTLTAESTISLRAARIAP